MMSGDLARQAGIRRASSATGAGSTESCGKLALAADDLGVRQQLADRIGRIVQVRAQEHGFAEAAGLEDAVGEDVPAVEVARDLDFVDGQEFHGAVERHRFDGADEIARRLRRDLFFAGDEGRGGLALGLDHFRS